MASVTMPKLSDSMEEGVIIGWLIDDGSDVEVGTEIAEIETDKATMVFQSEFAGKLVIQATAGESVQVGAPIAEILAAGEGLSSGGTRVGPANAPRANEVAPSTAAVASPPSVGDVKIPSNDAGSPSTRVSASPIARRVAQTLQIELADLIGSGPFGRIVKRDVLAAAADGCVEQNSGSHETARPLSGVAAPAGAATPAGATLAAPSGGRGAVVVETPTRVQSAIARRMHEAKSTMPEFTLEVDVDMDAGVRLRDDLKSLGGEVLPSYNDFVVRACALALRAHPWANAAYRDERFERFERVNVGVAVAVPGSLLVPTVFDADRRSLGDIAVETRRLAAAARDGQLTAAELDGGTFSVSNLGMYGVTRFTAVLNPPQAAILAVGAVEQRPVVRDGELVVAHRMAMTLTCDHRILYGADAATFLATIRANLEAPLRLAM